MFVHFCIGLVEFVEVKVKICKSLKTKAAICYFGALPKMLCVVKTDLLPATVCYFPFLCVKVENHNTPLFQKRNLPRMVCTEGVPGKGFKISLFCSAYHNYNLPYLWAKSSTKFGLTENSSRTGDIFLQRTILRENIFSVCFRAGCRV